MSKGTLSILPLLSCEMIWKEKQKLPNFIGDFPNFIGVYFRKYTLFFYYWKRSNNKICKYESKYEFKWLISY